MPEPWPLTLIALARRLLRLSEVNNRRRTSHQWFPPVRLSGKSGDVNILWQVVYLLLWLFRLALLGRIVIEFVRVFARSWRPAGPPAVAMEVLYASTDPPVKLFRKIIPTIKLGGVGFDLSIVVLLILVYVLMEIVARLALAAL